MKWADRAATDTAMKNACVDWLLGNRRKPGARTVEVYILPDGGKTGDKQTALDAWKAANA